MSDSNNDQLPSYSSLFKGDVSKWLDDYHAALPNVIAFVNNHSGVKTHIGIIDLKNAIPYIHASLIISDLTSLSIMGLGEKVVKICPDLVGAKITIPNKVILEQGIDINTNWKSVGYVQSSEKKAKMLARDLKPALRSKQAIIRPTRIALFKMPDGSFHAINCDPDCSKMEWIVSDQDKPNTVLPVKIVSEKSADIDLSVPYLTNTSTENFLSILRMNEDCISAIRVALSEATRNLENRSASDLIEIRRGIIDPKLEELKRAFHRIIKTSTIRIGAASVAAITLSLSAIAAGQDGLALNSVLGMGGFGLLATQYADYKDKLLYLKDNPFYLFWKMNK